MGTGRGGENRTKATHIHNGLWTPVKSIKCILGGGTSTFNNMVCTSNMLYITREKCKRMKKREVEKRTVICNTAVLMSWG